MDEREQAYRQLLDAVANPTWAFDLDAREVVFVGGRTEEICGYSPEELRATGLLDGALEHFARVMPERLAAYHRGERATYADEVRVPRRAGGFVWFETSSRICEDPISKRLILCGAAWEGGHDLLEDMERIAGIGAWSFDTVSGKGVWTREVAHIHEVPYTFEPSAEIGLDFYTPTSRPIIEAAVAEALTNGTPYDLELDITTATGARKWIRTIGRPRREHGRVVRLRGTMQDITAQKAVEDELAAQRAQLRTVLDNIPDLVFVKDLDGKYVECNPHFERLLGSTRGELVDKTDYDFSPVDVADFFRERDRIALERGVPTRNEETLTFADGHVELVEMSKSPIRGADGRIMGVLGVGRDITATRAASAALRASEERYRDFVENMADIVLSTDESGVVLFINQAIERFGYSRDDIIGSRLTAFLHPDDVAVADRWLGGDTVAAEVRLRSAGGDYLAQRARVRAIVGDGGEIRGLTCVCVDVSLLRETEQQLRLAQRMEAVGRLAGGMAHDFNNLLTVILASADVARSELPAWAGSDLREDLAQICAAGHRAEGLTKQLLAFSRRQVLQAESLRLDKVVIHLAEMLRRLIGEDIDLRFQTKKVATTMVDRGQIEQVVMNLVVNARDAMPTGGTLTIATMDVSLDESRARELELAPGDYVELGVVDTGTGIDKGTIARIFEPFFTTKPPGKGTGLGLATVYGIVKQSGGGIAVESESGKGTRFAIYLPRDRSEPATTSTRKAEARPSAMGTETILVVEDEDRLRRVVKRILESAGYSVMLAANGEDALAIAMNESHRISLVLSDVVMPKMSGSALVERLSVMYPTLKVLFTSGYTDDQIALHGVGNHHFLPKPFLPDQLREAVRSVLDSDDAP